MAEREISRGVARGLSCRQIAESLGRASSTVSRRHRNGGHERYRTTKRRHSCLSSCTTTQTIKLQLNLVLRSDCRGKLALQWSPQQISAWLACEYPDNKEMRVSHESDLYRCSSVPWRSSPSAAPRAQNTTINAPPTRNSTRIETGKDTGNTRHDQYLAAPARGRRSLFLATGKGIFCSANDLRASGRL